MRNLDADPGKLQVGEITANVMAYHNIQERRDQVERPICQNNFSFWEDL